jgi:hypothetical protein
MYRLQPYALFCSAVSAIPTKLALCSTLKIWLPRQREDYHTTSTGTDTYPRIVTVSYSVCVSSW